MAVAKLQKMQIFLLQKRTEEFLFGLQALRCFEITNIQENISGRRANAPEGESAAGTLRRTAAARRYQKVLNFLDTMFPRPRGFIENFIQVKPVVKHSAAAVFLKKQPNAALAQVEKLQADWERQNLQSKQLSGEIARQDLYAVFGLRKARQAAKLQKADVIFGSVPLKALDAEIMQVIKTTERTAYVQLVFLREDEAALRDRLHGAGFQEIVLPRQRQEYARVSRALKQNLKKLEIKAAKLKEKLAKINAAQYTRLAVWADYLTNAAGLEACADGLAATEKTSLLTGWVSVAQKKPLLNYLDGFAQDLYWREVEPDADETPPIVLQNKLTAPLEAVTSLYGMPHAQEFDPSPLMAPFFIVFYGLCLSDAGYGLMLAALAAFLLWKFWVNLTDFGKKLLTLNIYCGFSTIAVGLLTGNFFGIDFNILPWPAVKNFFLSLKIIDPMSNPLPLLGLSVGLGILQILTGLVLRWILDIRQRGWREAFLKSGCWVVFLSSLVGWAGVELFGSPALAAVGLDKTAIFVLASWLKYAALGGVVFMILTQGRQQKNPLLRLGSGLLSLYSLSSYVGDVLSYTRLFALGLVTAVLAMVINYLAAMTGGLPVVGIIFTAAIFIIGHILDFLINILGSFVHSARLQYVEYFSKFFEGGGRFFKPFSWQTKYVSFDDK